MKYDSCLHDIGYKKYPHFLIILCINEYKCGMVYHKMTMYRVWSIINDDV